MSLRIKTDTSLMFTIKPIVLLLLSVCTIWCREPRDSLEVVDLVSGTFQLENKNNGTVKTIEASRYYVLDSYGLIVFRSVGVGIGCQWIDNDIYAYSLAKISILTILGAELGAKANDNDIGVMSRLWTGFYPIGLQIEHSYTADKGSVFGFGGYISFHFHSKKIPNNHFKNAHTE